MEKTLTARLAEIQQKLKAPKSQFNKFAGFNYRSCEDILEAVKPLLGNLSLIISDNIGCVGIGGGEGDGEKRFYVVATVTLSDGENMMSATAYAREPEAKKGMDGSQITGAASSYARKYALNGLFAIDDTRDADTKDNIETETPTKKTTPKNKPAPKKTANAALVTKAQLGMIGVLGTKELGLTNIKITAAAEKLYGVKTLPGLTKVQASDFIDRLQDMANRTNAEDTETPEPVTNETPVRALVCDGKDCDEPLSITMAEKSWSKYGASLCMNCQLKRKAEDAPSGEEK